GLGAVQAGGADRLAAAVLARGRARVAVEGAVLGALARAFAHDARGLSVAAAGEEVAGRVADHLVESHAGEPSAVIGRGDAGARAPVADRVGGDGVTRRAEQQDLVSARGLLQTDRSACLGCADGLTVREKAAAALARLRLAGD